MQAQADDIAEADHVAEAPPPSASVAGITAFAAFAGIAAFAAAGPAARRRQPLTIKTLMVAWWIAADADGSRRTSLHRGLGGGFRPRLRLICIFVNSVCHDVFLSLCVAPPGCEFRLCRL